jgi:hypothetical protein
VGRDISSECKERDTEIEAGKRMKKGCNEREQK